MTIPNIPVVGGESIPFIQVNGTGIKLIQLYLTFKLMLLVYLLYVHLGHIMLG